MTFSGIVRPIGTIGIQGRTGEDVRLGVPTDGDLTDGLVALTETDTVVDAIDAINEAAKAVDEKTGADAEIGTPTDGDYSDGLAAITPGHSVADAVDLLNEACQALQDSVAGFADRIGWVRVVTVSVPGGTVSDQVFDDPPGNTILQSVTVSSGTFEVVLESSYPRVKLNGVPHVLPLVGSIYRGTLPITLAADGDVTAQLVDSDGKDGAVDTIAVAIDTPPTVTAAVFTGGYPGSQTELKEDDTYQLQVTADENFDQVVIADYGAGKAATLAVAVGTSATVSLTVADRGTTPQALAARVQVRDATTGALSAAYDTDAAGLADGVNLITLNNLAPSVSFGAIAYPPSQGALKGAEGATVPVDTLTDADTVDWTSPPGHLSITNPNETGPAFDASKSVARIGGSYNVDSDGGVVNLRATANRAANDATTVADVVINIANVSATVTVSEATARVRSGVAPGSDTTITIGADQELYSAPSLTPAVGAGTFQGVWTGGPKTWTRDLRVPDAENPADGSPNAWTALVATNLAGIVTSVISGDDTYVVGGFTARTLNFPAFTAVSTETFPLTTEAKLSAGAFSNGNTAVVQPFGTADTTDVGKEGWCAPTAASGAAVGMRMLHSPTVGANSGGLTLTLVQEAV